MSESNIELTRRASGKLALSSGLALAAAGVAKAQSSELSVVISSAYRKSFEQFVIPTMQARHGIRLAASTFLSSEALSRAMAQKSSPAISMFTLDEGPWLQGDAVGLWQKLDADKLPNMADIPPAYVDRNGRGVTLFNWMAGLLYDADALRKNGIEAPTSILDMWKPAYKGKIVLPQFSSTLAFALLSETNRLIGGSKESYDAGFAKLRALKPNVGTFFGPAGQIIQLLQQKEFWLTYGPHFSALQAGAAGLPAVWKVPSDGAVAMSHYIAIPANAPNIEGTYKLANLMLSPEYQAKMATVDYMGPVNRKTELDPAFAAKFPITRAATENASFVPWADYIRDRIKLAERWEREIQQ